MAERKQSAIYERIREILESARAGATHQIVEEISHAERAKFWQPGLLHPNLSWTHYRTLLRVVSDESLRNAD